MSSQIYESEMPQGSHMELLEDSPVEILAEERASKNKMVDQITREFQQSGVLSGKRLEQIGIFFSH